MPAHRYELLTPAQRKAIARTIRDRKIVKYEERDIVYSHLDAFLVEQALGLIDLSLKPKIDWLAHVTGLCEPVVRKHLRQWQRETGHNFGIVPPSDTAP